MHINHLRSLTLAAVLMISGTAAAALWAQTAKPTAAKPGQFVSLFNGKDLSGWKIPEGDNGHWKVVDGVIDYDAMSEAKGDKSLFTENRNISIAELR